MRTPKFKINWRYAIGEFLIVVIGILVAFQLDAWKEEQDESLLIREYLTDIKVGLETDSVFYKNALTYFDSINSRIDRTKAYLEQGQLDLPRNGQGSLRQLNSWYRVYISNTAFLDLNNSGRLNLIDSKDLRYNLISYYNYIDFVKLQDEEYNTSLGRMEEDLLGSIKFRDSLHLTIPEDQVDKVLNYLNKKQSYMNSYLGHRENCNYICASIIEQIDSSLQEID